MLGTTARSDLQLLGTAALEYDEMVLVRIARMNFPSSVLLWILL